MTHEHAPKRTKALNGARATKSLQTALSGQFAIELDTKGYASRIEDVLLPGVERTDFERDLAAGAGNELDHKFLAAHSSSQLVVNAFAPFRRQLPDLHIATHHGWSTLQFEAKCEIWEDYRGIAPHLDALLTTPESVMGIESKCTEYLSHKPAKFRRSYFDNITDDRRSTRWFHELERLSAEPNAYRYLDAAQLVKHALGLAFSYPNGKITLLYLYWEPDNRDTFTELTVHRNEVDDFARRVAGERVTVEGLSYLDLWNQWSRSGIDWLEQHAMQLARRYRVQV